MSTKFLKNSDIIEKHLSKFRELYIYLLSLLGFATLYWISKLPFSIDDCVRSLTFMESLYFSVVTGTTVGFGDITPDSKIIRIPVLAQAILIPLLFARYLSRTQSNRERDSRKAAQKARRQFLLMRLHQELGMLVRMLGRPPQDEQAKITFETDGNSDHILHTEYYDDGKYTQIVKQRNYDNDLFREVEFSKLNKIYKRALEYALYQLSIYRIDSEIPKDIENELRVLLIKSQDLIADLGTPFDADSGVRFFDGVDLDDAWKKDQLKRLDYIVHLIEKIHSKIESQNHVHLSIPTTSQI